MDFYKKPLDRERLSQTQVKVCVGLRIHPRSIQSREKVLNDILPKFQTFKKSPSQKQLQGFPPGSMAMESITLRFNSEKCLKFGRQIEEILAQKPIQLVFQEFTPNEFHTKPQRGYVSLKGQRNRMRDKVKINDFPMRIRSPRIPNPMPS